MLRELTRMCTRFSETIRNWFLETGEVSAFGPPSLLISIFGGGQLPVYENRFKKQKKKQNPSPSQLPGRGQSPDLGLGHASSIRMRPPLICPLPLSIHLPPPSFYTACYHGICKSETG